MILSRLSQLTHELCDQILTGKHCKSYGANEIVIAFVGKALLKHTQRQKFFYSAVYFHVISGNELGFGKRVGGLNRLPRAAVGKQSDVFIIIASCSVLYLLTDHEKGRKWL